MSDGPQIVIVGGGHAGTAAAITLRQGGWQGAIVLIGNEGLLPYERPPLSKAILLEQADLGPKLLLVPERLEELSINYRQNCSVVSIDRATHTVTLSDSARLVYERLLLATGARPRNLSIPIAEGCRTSTLRTYADALAIRRFAAQGSEVVVIGGGHWPQGCRQRDDERCFSDSD